MDSDLSIRFKKENYIRNTTLVAELCRKLAPMRQFGVRYKENAVGVLGLLR